MQKPRIPPHPTTKQEILFLRRMGFPAQKKMKDLTQRLIGIMEKIHQSQAHGAAVHLYC